MSKLAELEIGAPGPFLPPYERVLKNAQLIDFLGYDSMAFPDHFAGFVPESIWTTDITPLALLQQSPHTYYELTTIMAACASVTERVKLLSSVTEPIRRHPILLAQAFLTLDHISNGRAILGIGAGEIENIEPYGLSYHGQVGKLKEALQIIRRVWNSHEPFSFEGRYWKLKDAVMSLRPVRPGHPPPVWIAAHGPKMLEIAAEFGDGWLPTLLRPLDYGEKLKAILAHKRRIDRNVSFTAALWNWCILDEDIDACDKMKQTPLAKALALLYPSSEWKRLGYEHPFGDDFYSLRDYIPMRHKREEILNAIESVPPEVLNEFYMSGGTEDIISLLEKYVHEGLDHIILWNSTGMFDLEKTRSSYKVLKEVLSYVKGQSDAGNTKRE
ncbi:MAG: LLM class flavin-dependent oxidoreductase [Candidatus Thorarchaeota archaeon]|nr:LLM class flavin-dependent oxidoreductase [Candidatus Thorarchaeota archaeon]